MIFNGVSAELLYKLLEEKAPAGYGLGAAELISADIDNITAPGWYCWNYTMSIAGITANYWFMRVDAYGAGASHCVQHIYPCVSNYQIVEIVRRKYAGDWEVSEIINPPMQLNTEYCTSERWNGKHVYVKRISFGSLPSAGSSNVSTGISGGTPVSLTGTFFDGSGNAEPYPVMAGTGTKCLCWLSSDCGKLYVQSIADCSAYTGEFVVKYTKE